MIKDLGIGFGTFLKCYNYKKKPSHEVEIVNDSMLLVGASLYALVNIISREKYDEFSSRAKNNKEVDFSFQNEFET